MIPVFLIALALMGVVFGSIWFICTLLSVSTPMKATAYVMGGVVCLMIALRAFGVAKTTEPGSENQLVLEILQ